jgi:hypothetical protein
MWIWYKGAERFAIQTVVLYLLSEIMSAFSLYISILVLYISDYAVSGITVQCISVLVILRESLK